MIKNIDQYLLPNFHCELFYQKITFIIASIFNKSTTRIPPDKKSASISYTDRNSIKNKFRSISQTFIIFPVDQMCIIRIRISIPNC